MENVNFKCGSCGQIMAVGASSVGQQVRCPHCQQIVLADAPTNPAPAAALEAGPSAQPPGGFFDPTNLGVPPVSEIESIFTSPEANSDALFGGPPRGLVEMPPDPLPPPPVEPPPPGPAEAPVLGPMETTLTYQPEPAAPAGVDARTEPDPAAFQLGPATPGAGSGASAAVDEEALARAIPRPRIRPPADRGGWLIALLIVPLISYSILATVAVVYLRFFQPPPTNQPHPLEMFPDLEGENPGVKPGKKKITVKYHDHLQEKDLPPQLRTTFGKPIQIGELEVEPISVELRRIVFVNPGHDPEPSEKPTLVLNLRLTNRSKNQTFHPLDPFFERRWVAKKGEGKDGMPFTYLTVGKEHFYGGPLLEEDRRERHETIKGQKLEHVLEPGESFDTFVCTSPDDAVQEAVEQSRGPMLWRVQVRRGLVKTPHRGELSASAVVGVEFTRDQVHAAAGLD
jgi:hypothetical protein